MKRFLLSVVCILPLLCFGQWEQVSSLPSSFQTDHSFAFALDGAGYIVTGAVDPSGAPSKTFYTYDSEADEWNRKEDFPGTARGFAIGDTYDGKAYLGFGLNGAPLNDLWEYDPNSDQWTELATFPGEARFHPALVAHDGKLYVAMGGSNYGNRKDMWAYDIATDEWEQLPDFPGAARHHPFQFAVGDYVYMGFGHGSGFISNEWYRYDPSDATWLQVASIPAEGRVAGTQFAFDGKGYILSGDGQDHSSMEEGEFWEYDPEADSWEQLTPHPGKSRWAPASFVLDHEVYLINGPSFINGQGYVYQSEVYKYRLAPPVSTGDIEDIRSYVISPNPFENTIQVKRTDNNIMLASARILDVKGVTIAEFSQLEEELDLSKLSAGIYFLEIFEDGKTVIETIVKN